MLILLNILGILLLKMLLCKCLCLINISNLTLSLTHILRFLLTLDLLLYAWYGILYTTLTKGTKLGLILNLVWEILPKKLKLRVYL